MSPLPLPCLPSQPDFYLGKLGNFIKLVVPDEYYPATLDDARVDHALVTGAHAVQHVDKMRRRYGFTWTARLAEAADQITSIQGGQLGPGPYYLIDPLWRNVLPRHISGCGRKLKNSAGFYVTGSGTVGYADAPVYSPVMASGLTTGVQAWTGSGNGDLMYMNAVSNAGVLEATAPPMLMAPAAGAAMLPVTVSVWLKTATGTVTGLQLGWYTNDSNGAYQSGGDLTACNLTTGWTQFSGTLPVGSVPAGAGAFGVRLRSTSAANPVIHVAAPMANYYAASVGGVGANQLPPWVLGLGVPQVLVGSSAPSNHAKATHRRTVALDLVEAV